MCNDRWISSSNGTDEMLLDVDDAKTCTGLVNHANSTSASITSLLLPPLRSKHPSPHPHPDRYLGNIDPSPIHTAQPSKWCVWLSSAGGGRDGAWIAHDIRQAWLLPPRDRAYPSPLLFACWPYHHTKMGQDVDIPILGSRSRSSQPHPAGGGPQAQA